MRLNLFLKIFLGFWLACIAVLGTWMVTDNYLQAVPGRDTLRESHHLPAPPHRFLRRMMYELQQAPPEQLPQLVLTAQKNHRVTIYLLDANGFDLLERDVPAAVEQLAGKLSGSQQRAVAGHSRQLILAHRIYRSDTGPLRAVFQFQPRRHLVGLLSGQLWARLLMAVLVSGVICYGLSRLMTRRLGTLRHASRQLANGDLDTRIPVRGQGGDETDELARDFNSMAQQLQERIDAQKRLLQDVSHELRSPLARLRVALALAQQEPAGGTADYLVRIERETERLEELIEQLLSSQSGDLNMDTHIDLVSLLRTLCEDASFEGAPRGVTVRFACPLQQAVVRSSGDLLQRSFENILRNAITHSPSNSEISTVLEQIENSFRVVITDEGAGVPEGELDKIFGEFYRVDKARGRDSGGHGLGLSITRRAIEQHGGSVTAYNTESGFAVAVTLPG